MDATFETGGWTVTVLIQGYPGKTRQHGGLGWSTVALLQGHGHTAVLDGGNLNVRGLLIERLAAHGVAPADVTDVLLSHLHYDHCVNWPMFPNAAIAVGAAELDWALAAPAGDPLLPELYIQTLSRRPDLRRLAPGDQVLPGVTVHHLPGHTPGHLGFAVEGAEHDILLVQDAAKYHAELRTRQADMTYDPGVTARTIEAIWTAWRRKPGSIVIPGHDLPVRLEQGELSPIGRHAAAIISLMGASIDDRRTIELQ